jgi:hypothetical protein
MDSKTEEIGDDNRPKMKPNQLSPTKKRKRNEHFRQPQKISRHQKDAQELALEKMLFGDKDVTNNLGKELEQVKLSQLESLKSLFSEEDKMDSEVIIIKKFTIFISLEWKND